LLLIPSVISGAAWAGIHLATGNFVYDNTSHEKRSHIVSYYNMMWGIGVALGAGLGALLIKFLNTSFIEPIIAIFIISAITRTLVAIWWLPKIKEVRKTRKFKTQKVLKHIIFKEAAPTIAEEIHEIASIKKYLNPK
jgi:MFS family permease